MRPAAIAHGRNIVGMDRDVELVKFLFTHRFAAE